MSDQVIKDGVRRLESRKLQLESDINGLLESFYEDTGLLVKIKAESAIHSQKALGASGRNSSFVVSNMVSLIKVKVNI